MSKSLMNDLLRSLKADGWLHLNSASIFAIESEVVHWKMEHAQTQTIIDLEFHVFGDLGHRSDSLNDIFYCIVRHYGIKLYFEKRESEKWKHASHDFIMALREICQR